MKSQVELNRGPLVDPAHYGRVTAQIRAEGERLLSSGSVAAIIGYVAGRRPGSTIPAVITTPGEAALLVFSPGCRNNLSRYLTRKGELPAGRIAIVAKGCDLRGVAGLMGENQVRRDELHIIGVACPGVYAAGADGRQPLTESTIAPKCRECSVHIPDGIVDMVAGELPALPELAPVEREELRRLEEMTPAQRWQFWKEEFSRCIRCLACRQVCPFCFCHQCLCDRNRPQGIESSPRPAGNMAWHIIRAMHLAGRCAGCAECERVCPMGIPLNLLNRKMAEEMKALYGHEAGLEPREKGPLVEYRLDDDQSFIR